MKVFFGAIGAILTVLGFIGVLLSAFTARFAMLGAVITALMYIFLGGFSAWWIIGVPVVMLVGGIVGYGITLLVATLGTMLMDE